MPTYFKDHHIRLFWQQNDGFPKDWTRVELKRWVEAAGGKITFNTEAGRHSTHIVCSKASWEKHAESIQKLCDRRSNDSKVSVVSIDWLVECLRNGKKQREHPYLWSKLSKKKLSKARVQPEDDDNDDVDNPADLFVKHSKQFVDKRDQEALEAKHAAEDAERAELEARLKRQEELEREYEARVRRENAALIRRGIRKSRNEIFSDEHHVYRDVEGFPYEITLTKIDLSKNRNERVTITIYESNAEPHTYATNLHRASTGAQPSNNILVAIGSTFEVARRQFVTVFAELAHKTWDNRFTQLLPKDIPFDQQPFSYIPPQRGPKGEGLFAPITINDSPDFTPDPSLTEKVMQEETSVGTEAHMVESGEPEMMEQIPTEPEQTVIANKENLTAEAYNGDDQEVSEQELGQPVNDSSDSERPLDPTMLEDVVVEAEEEASQPLLGGSSSVYDDLQALATEETASTQSETEQTSAIDTMHQESHERDEHDPEQRAVGRMTEPPADKPHWSEPTSMLCDSTSDTEGSEKHRLSRKRKFDDFFEGFPDMPANERAAEEHPAHVAEDTTWRWPGDELAEQ